MGLILNFQPIGGLVGGLNLACIMSHIYLIVVMEMHLTVAAFTLGQTYVRCPRFDAHAFRFVCLYH